MSHETEVLWTAGFLDERFPAPVSPLGWSVVGAQFEELALRDPLRMLGYPDAESVPATRLWHGHPYANVLIFQIIYSLFPAFLVPTDATRYFPNRDISIRTLAPYPRSLLDPRFLIALIAHLGIDPINVSPFNFWQWSRFVRSHDSRVQELAARLDGASSPREILNVIDATFALDADFLRIHRWSLTYADLFYKILSQWVGDLAQPLISDVPNKTDRLNADLRYLAEIAGQSNLDISAIQIQDLLAGPGQSEFKNALADFVSEHGHRSFGLDISQPTFREDPEQFIEMIRQPAVSHRIADDNLSIEARARKRLKAWQLPLFNSLLGLTRKYSAMREDQRYQWQKSLYLTRRAYLLLARDITSREVISLPETVFYATRSELADFYSGRLSPDNLRGLIEARRAEWQEYYVDYARDGAASYPSFLNGDSPFPTESSAGTSPKQDSATLEWKGSGVSPGVARGKARVILDPHELGRINSGEILVAPSTDPGWTAVFPELAGLVLERGGVLSHGAVVAREYHLPAVAGLTNLTRILKDGDSIEVDGTQGIVKLFPKQL